MEGYKKGGWIERVDVLTKATERTCCTSLLLRLRLAKQTSTRLLWLLRLSLSKGTSRAECTRASSAYDEVNTITHENKANKDVPNAGFC